MDYNGPYGAPAGSPYVNGNPATGTRGSIPPAAAFEHPQREILAVQDAAGLERSSADLKQLLRAVRSGVLSYYVDTGAADTMVIAPTPAHAAYVPGLTFRIKVAAANTGAATLNVNGLGAKAVRSGTLALSGGELVAGQIAELTYDGTNFQLSNPNLTTTNIIQGAPRAQVVFTSSGTWVCPPNVTRVFAKVQAPGGGGGGAYYGSGQAAAVGGGGGEYREGICAVVPGVSYTITVGQPGSAGVGVSWTSGGPGGTTSFHSFITSIGGGGGSGANSGILTAGMGVPGTGGSGGTRAIAGGGGGAAYMVGSASASGIGGPSYMASINSLNLNSAGASGRNGGGGGSGGATITPSTGAAGGAGGAGFVELIY